MATPHIFFEFPPDQRCEACKSQHRGCILRQGDSKCKSCVDYDDGCVFRRPAVLEGSPVDFLWDDLVHRSCAMTINPRSVNPHQTILPKMYSPLDGLSVLADTAVAASQASSQEHATGPVVASPPNPPFPPRYLPLPPLTSPASILLGNRQKRMRSSRNSSPDRMDIDDVLSDDVSAKDQENKKRQFWCDVQDCKHSRPFPTRNDLERHKLSVHKILPTTTNLKIYICQGRSCVEMGKKKEWLRKDNFKSHCKYTHPLEDYEDLMRRSEVSPESASATFHRSNLGPFDLSAPIEESSSPQPAASPDEEKKSPDGKVLHPLWEPISNPAGHESPTRPLEVPLDKTDNPTETRPEIARVVGKFRPKEDLWGTSKEDTANQSDRKEQRPLKPASETATSAKPDGDNWPCTYGCGASFNSLRDSHAHQLHCRLGPEKRAQDMRPVPEVKSERSGPEFERPGSDNYNCMMPNCDRYFKRATDLERHYVTVHRNNKHPLIDCKHGWCGRTGDRGFTRTDHYRDHLREVHREDIPKSRKAA